MIIYSIYVISKSGGLIYNHDHFTPKVEIEQVFSYPLNFKLAYENKRIVVTFGQRDGIMVGHELTCINGDAVVGKTTKDGEDVLEFLNQETNYPVNIKFSRPKMTTNEKIFLASMFYPLFAIASQLSPELKSSGIEVLETDSFKLHCFQTVTGVKFIVITECIDSSMELFLKKVYELYADYVLKNPFYALEMPIRCELFDSALQVLLEQFEKNGVLT